MQAGETPTFFIPRVAAERWEEVFEELSSLAGRNPAPIGDRVYSIKLVHDTTTWTATVGAQMTGTRTTTARQRGGKVERSAPTFDNSEVLAILPGVPFLVWHDNQSRLWANPFLAGVPQIVTRFSAPIAE